MIPIALFLTTVLIIGGTVWGFNNPQIKEWWIFDKFRILSFREYYRLVSSAFLHADYQHLGFNVVGLVLFGETLEQLAGWWAFLLIFFLSVIGGSLASLYFHRADDEYIALGASGGVLGVIFGSLQLAGSSVSSLFTPGLSIPAPLFAAGYLAVSYIAMRRRIENVGHAAHIGGAATGFLTLIIINPESISRNPTFFWTMIGMATLALIYHFWHSQISNLLSIIRNEKPKRSLRDQDYDQALEMGELKRELDHLLDKVSASGMKSLTPKEEKRLRDLSEKL